MIVLHKICLYFTWLHWCCQVFACKNCENGKIPRHRCGVYSLDREDTATKKQSQRATAFRDCFVLYAFVLKSHNCQTTLQLLHRALMFETPLKSHDCQTSHCAKCGRTMFETPTKSHNCQIGTQFLLTGIVFKIPWNHTTTNSVNPLSESLRPR